MCLGEPALVLEVRGGGELVVRASRGRCVVSAMTLEGGAHVGEWVLTHSGFALSRLTAEEAFDAVALRGHAGEERS